MENEPVYTEDMYRVAIVKTAELKMYTNRTQITDTVLINKYIKQYSKYFNLDKTPIETELKMRFIGTDSVAFQNSPGKYSFTKSGNKYIFTSAADVNRPGNMPLYIDLFKYSSPYTPYNISATQVLYHTKDMRVGYGTPIEMALPVMSYKVSSRPSNNFYYTATGISFNEFDEAVLPKLGINDTLAIQLFRYDMKARLIEQ
jgi:hypothetical protein